MWYLYILFCDQTFFYIGITRDLFRRLIQHQRGYEIYTKRYRSIELFYTESYKKRADAEKREIQLKGWSKAKKKALITGDIEKLRYLSKSDTEYVEV